MVKRTGVTKGVKFIAIAGMLALYLTFGASVAKPSYAGGKGKIAFCNFQKAAKESRTGKKLLDGLKKDLQTKSRSLEDKKNRLERLKSDLNKKSKVMDESLKKQKEEEYFKSMRDFQRLREDVEADLKKKEMEFTRTMMRKLQKVVLKIGVEDGYDVIFPKETSAYFSEKLDITDQVIKALDRSSK